VAAGHLGVPSSLALWARSAGGAALALSLSCSLLRPVDELEGAPSDSLDVQLAPASPASSCARDAECTREEGRCLEEEQTCAPCPGGMQQVSFGDGLAFCIDRYETTQGEYNQFLAALAEQPSLDLPDAELCPATESFEPGGGADCLSAYDRGGDADLPMVCVDLCDAMAYCHWQGKRLCGGRDGLRLDRTPQTVNKPNDDEWLAACGGTGGSKYPYGDVYEASRCNVASEQVEVEDSFRDCKTPNHIYQLSGNVAEWVLVCNDNREFGEQRCLVRGGEYRTTDPEFAACAHLDLSGAAMGAVFPRRALQPADFSPGVGIRCCMD
jgi:formylglycine-generating enzyme